MKIKNVSNHVALIKTVNSLHTILHYQEEIKTMEHHTHVGLISYMKEAYRMSAITQYEYNIVVSYADRLIGYTEPKIIGYSIGEEEFVYHTYREASNAAMSSNLPIVFRYDDGSTLSQI